MKKIVQILLLALLLAPCRLLAQSFEVPKSYTLKTKEDYAKYEDDVLKGIEWIADTPWDTEPEKRIEINAFLFKWIMGTPTFTMDLDPKAMELTKGNKELLSSFMYGYAKHAIIHKVNLDVPSANTAGVLAMIVKYQSERHHQTNEDIEQAIKANDQGALAEWVSRNFH